MNSGTSSRYSRARFFLFTEREGKRKAVGEKEEGIRPSFRRRRRRRRCSPPLQPRSHLSPILLRSLSNRIPLFKVPARRVFVRVPLGELRGRRGGQSQGGARRRERPLVDRQGLRQALRDRGGGRGQKARRGRHRRRREPLGEEEALTLTFSFLLASCQTFFFIGFTFCFARLPPRPFVVRATNF
jgi:hypothetical protein